jgi:nondiscriminating glutamyl-tRNA synthetase
MTDPLKEILGWETTPKIVSYIAEEIGKVSSSFLTEAELNNWMEHVKKNMGVKGKPLFQGVRAALTGHDHGPDLKFLIPLTPVNVIKKRVGQLKA